MAQHFTFVICVSCGVQSPPIIVREGSIEMGLPLAAMGWKFDKMRFTAQAVCPTCLAFKKDNAKSEAV